jgi:two-component system, sensor histidine kinase and response regulator
METLKILVVDDEPGIRSGVARILRNHTVSYPFMDDDFGFIVLEAATGEESIEIIGRDKPDIMLLDNKLPGIQGMEVLQHVKEKQLDIVVAMITSYASIEVAVKATGDGASDFIPKPFTPQELRSSIDNITKQLYLKRITRKLNTEGRQIRFQFLSVLSHELKAPLNAIEGYLRMMQERQAGNEIGGYDKMIERSLNRVKSMRNLIMDLLDFTKIRFERKQEEMVDLDIRQVARMAVNTIQPYAIQRNIQIFLNREHPLVIKADTKHFEIIFNNLISNAVKYNLDNGRVDIDLSDELGRVVIAVKDTGVGMDKEDMAQLFREFVRIKNEKTRDITGSGLGLSIVKQLVDLYNGEIKVESVPEKGSTFTLLLPLPQS